MLPRLVHVLATQGARNFHRNANMSNAWASDCFESWRFYHFPLPLPCPSHGLRGALRTKSCEKWLPFFASFTCRLLMGLLALILSSSATALSTWGYLTPLVAANPRLIDRPLNGSCRLRPLLSRIDKRGKSMMTAEKFTDCDAQIGAKQFYGQHSDWRDMYRVKWCPGSLYRHQGQYFKKHPEENMHYRTKTRYLKLFVHYLEHGGVLETHGDVSDSVFEQLYAEENQGLDKNKCTSGITTMCSMSSSNQYQYIPSGVINNRYAPLLHGIVSRPASTVSVPLQRAAKFCCELNEWSTLSFW